MTLALVVDDLRILFIGLRIVGARGVLQLGNGVWRPHMVFATGAPSIFAARLQHAVEHRVFAIGCCMDTDSLFCHLKHANTTHLRGRAIEVFVHKLGVQTDGFKNL